MYAEKQNRKRFTLSLFLALGFHGATFFAFQYLIPVWNLTKPERTGPLIVTIEREAPPQVRQPAQETTPVRQTQKAPAAAAEEQPAVQSQTKVTASGRTTDTPRRTDTARASGSTRVSDSAKTAGIEPARGADVPIRPAVSAPVSASKGIVGPEIIEEEVPAPVDEDAVMPPIQGRSFQDDKKADVPFTPKSEVRSSTLAFDVGNLDRALEKSAGSSAPGIAAANAPGTTGKTASTQQGSEPGERTGGTNRPAAAPSSGSASGTPLIEWDTVASARTLTYTGPPPAIPSWVKNEGLDLKVAVSFAVTPEGHTTSVRIGTTSGYTDVDTAILDAVRKMRFNSDPKSEIVTGTITYIISPKS